MSTELRDRLSDAYPQTDISAPSADVLWQQGRRQRRHRATGVTVAVTAVVAAAGVGVASMTPPPAGPASLSTQPSDTEEEDVAADPTDPETQPVPEPANEGDVPRPFGDDVPEVDEDYAADPGGDIPEVSDGNEAAQAPGGEGPEVNLYDGLERGADPTAHGWVPSASPVDLEPLRVTEPGPQWYLDEAATYGLVDLEAIGDRLGSQPDAEQLCDFLRQEKDAAKAAVGGPVDVDLVVYHLLEAELGETPGDGLTLALARACYL